MDYLYFFTLAWHCDRWFGMVEYMLPELSLDTDMLHLNNLKAFYWKKKTNLKIYN